MRLRFGVIVGIIFVAALFRLLPHAPNVTPIAALALFGAVQLSDRRLAFLIPLAALLLSDLILGLHATMPFVYLGFALTVLMGFWLRNNRLAPGTLLAASLISSTSFFVLTNFGSWLLHDMYPQTFEGLQMAYVAGLPFFRNQLLGDLFFVALLFGGYALAERRLPALRVASR